MAEFNTLPLSADGLIPRAAFNEITNAIIRRVPGIGALTIYNSSGDAEDATVEVHGTKIESENATTNSSENSLTDVGAFAGVNIVGKTCEITKSRGGLVGNFIIISHTGDKLIFKITRTTGYTQTHQFRLWDDIWPYPFTGQNTVGKICTISSSIGGNTGDFIISSQPHQFGLIFTTDPGNGTSVEYSIPVDPGNGTDVHYHILGVTGETRLYLTLKVIGGANEHKTTFTLNDENKNTVEKLVDFINDFGMGWIAVVKGGPTASVGFGRLSYTGLAHVLGAEKITWLTCYTDYSLGIMSGSLIKKITLLRFYIDRYAPGFYIEDTIGIDGQNAITATSDKSLIDNDKFIGRNLANVICTIELSTGGNTDNFTIVSNTDNKLIFTTDPGNGTNVHYYINPRSYTAETLHNAAFGSTVWDPVGPPNLTLYGDYTCLTHIKLWNDMKACLDLMKWKRQVGGTWWSGYIWPSSGAGQNENWDVARAAGFASLYEDTDHKIWHCVGRMMTAGLFEGEDEDPDYYICRISSPSAEYAGSKQVDTSHLFSGDLTFLDPLPRIIDGYCRISFVKPAHFFIGEEDIVNVDIELNLYLEGVLINTSPFSVEVLGGYRRFIHFDNISDVDFELEEGPKQCTYSLRYLGNMNSDPGAEAWPAPSLPYGYWPNGTGYRNGVGPRGWNVYTKWDFD